MVDNHNYSFFGQNTGLTLRTSSKSESYLFIQCIKKKQNGSWEKPSIGEGKVIKCSLEELTMILQVLSRKLLKWNSYYTYKDIKTPISFGWDDENAKILWINISNYSKMLNFAQVEVFRLLLKHIIKEKIKYSTIFEPEKEHVNETIDLKQEFTYVKEEPQIKKQPYINLRQNENMTNEMSKIEGYIKGETQKALLINFTSGPEVWIPKSTIHNQYNPQKNLTQEFFIDSWILKRNKII